MLSFGEIVVIILVALVVLGPKKTHALVNQIGRWAGRARVYWRNLSEELERETDTADIMRELRETRRTLSTDAEKFRSSVVNFERQVRETGKSFAEDVKPKATTDDTAPSAPQGDAPTPDSTATPNTVASNATPSDSTATSKPVTHDVSSSEDVTHRGS